MATYLPHTKVSGLAKQLLALQVLPKSLRSRSFRHILNSGKSLWFCVVGEDKKKSKWLWPLGLLATGFAGAGVMLFRGCWHGKMSWPVRAQGYSYQVCLSCGIKRLFDEEAFRAYGPYSYDLNRLISLADARPRKIREAGPGEHRTAS